MSFRYPRFLLGLVLLLAMTVGFGGGMIVDQLLIRSSSQGLPAVWRTLNPPPTAAQLENLQTVWQAIHREYVETSINDQQLMDGVIGGLVSGLGDPYSAYFTPAEAEAFQNEISGTFEGIGLEIGYKNNLLTVITPLPNTPAAQVGLQAGDVLLMIDQQDVSQLKLEEAVKAIRGPKGSTVTLQIQRGTESEPRTLKITRQTITVDPVSNRLLTVGQHRYGYIKISSFNDQTNALFQQAARSFLGQAVDGYILDLRNDPGGLLDQSIKVVSTFLVGGPVVIEETRQGERKTLSVDGTAYLRDQPLAVLVNEGTASASEIVAGALQDAGRATIIGRPTFGKGSVQDYQTLSGGASLKLTVAKWLTPKGRSISAQGITPDISVDLTPDDQNHDRDPQLARAQEWLESKQ